MHSIPSSEKPNRVFEWFIPGLALIAAALNGAKLLALFPDRWDTTTPEGSIAYSIQAVAGATHALYRDFHVPPFTTTPYAPLFYLLSGGLARLAGGTPDACYLAGRAVSLGSLLGCLILVYLLLGNLGLSRRAKVTASLLALSSPFVFPWAVSCRPDFLALFFSLSGAWIFASGRLTNRRLALSVLAFVLAAFTKQSFLAGPIAAALTLLRFRRLRNSLVFLVGFVVGIAALAGLTQIITHGAFIENIVTANLTPPFPSGALQLFFGRFLPDNSMIILLGMLSLFRNDTWNIRWRAGDSEDGSNRIQVFLPFFTLISTVFFTASCLKSGADLNYFLEPAFLLAAIASAGIDPICARLSVDAFRASFLMLISVAAFQFTAVILETTWAFNQPGREAMTKIARNPVLGRKLFVHNSLGFRYSGDQTFSLPDGYNASYLEDEGKLDLSSLRQQIENHSFKVIVTGSGIFQGHSVVPRSLAAAIEQNYRLVTELAGLRVYALPGIDALLLSPEKVLIPRPADNQAGASRPASRSGPSQSL